jgi:AAA15 family ATPase/GTPase
MVTFMLIEFSVKNYRSFKEKQTFSMKASPYDKDTTADEENARRRQIGKLYLLPAAAIYGANSSGKSNLLSAMRIMRKIILTSVKMNSADRLPVDQFALDENSLEAPTEFEVLFYMEEKIYRYGFAYTRDEIRKEWLYEKLKVREQSLFIREGSTLTISKNFKEGEGKADMVSSNRLFLSLIDLLNGEISKKIINWFKHFNVISGSFNKNFRDYSIELLLKNDGKPRASKLFLKQMDLGFSELNPGEQDIDESIFPPNVPQKVKENFLKEHANEKMHFLESAHTFRRKDGTTSQKLFDTEEMESEGTLKILDLSGPIIDTLANGYTLVIDELDAQLHPLLTQRIIQIFNSQKGNPHNAQLIFATHDTNLLRNKILRRDQIWFVEKDKTDEFSRLKSLSDIEIYDKNDYRKVRRDRIFEKDYFDNLYGALPDVGEDFDLVEAMGNQG